MVKKGDAALFVARIRRRWQLRGNKNCVPFFTLAAEPVTEPLLERLDPPRRAAVVMALLGIVLVGVLLVACVMIGAHWVRGMARRGRGPTTQTTNAANRRLREALGPILPQGKTDETTIAKSSTDDTVAEP
jgi:hypothetical protein